MTEQEKWLGLGKQQMPQEKDSESLSVRIQKLLSLDPTSLGMKKDKFASTNIVKPVGDIRKQLNKGFFDPTCRLMLGSQDVSGISYYHSYFNLDSVELTDLVLHVYNKPITRPPLSGLPEAMTVVHGHTREEYCPWKGGCHVLLSRDSCRVHKSTLPQWFIDMWRELYEF